MKQKGSFSDFGIWLQAVWNSLRLAPTDTGIQKKASSRPFVLHSDVAIISIFRLTRRHDVITLMPLICSVHPFWLCNVRPCASDQQQRIYLV